MEIQIFLDHITFDLGGLVTFITGIIIPVIKYCKKRSKWKQVVEVKKQKHHLPDKGRLNK